MLSVEQARLSVPPDTFEDNGCSCFPDRLLSPCGWANLASFCRLHDWHYFLLRRYRRSWGPDEALKFREWADLKFYLGLTGELRRKFGRVVGDLIARSMWAAVRSTLGEAAAWE